MSSSPVRKVLVWDAPTRVFHWLCVVCFCGAYASADSERWRLLHVTLGYTLAGLLVFRLIWGVLGTHYARFASFVRGPAAIVRYLRALRSAAPEHHVGHNPAGALAIVLMLACMAFIVVSGWLAYEDIGGDALAQWHDRAGNILLALVCVHLGGVVLASLLHRENLVRAMITGYKSNAPATPSVRMWAGLGAVILVAVLLFWWFQWRYAP